MVYLKKDNQVAEINEEKIIDEKGQIIYSNFALSLISNGFIEMTESEIEKYLEDKKKKEEYKNNPIVSYENKIVALIRKKYNVNQELAILRQRDTKPEEFAEYNEYVEQCKSKVKSSFTIGI